MTLKEYNIIKNAMQNAIGHIEYLEAMARESSLFTTKEAIELLEGGLKTLANVGE